MKGAGAADVGLGSGEGKHRGIGPDYARRDWLAEESVIRRVIRGPADIAARTCVDERPGSGGCRAQERRGEAPWYRAGLRQA